MHIAMHTDLSTWATIALLIVPTSAFYIPFFSVHSYPSKSPIPLLVNKVYSDTSQLQYAYYDLPFVCPRPTSRPLGTSGLFSGQNIPLNLGEVLRGDRITASDISLRMQEDNECSVLCARRVDPKALKRARELVKEGYVVEWIVDNLPGATSFVTVDKTRKYYAAGFKLGQVEGKGHTQKVYLNNHFTIVIRYRNAQGRKGERGEKVVVGFEVYPKSVGPSAERDGETGCPADLVSKGGEKFELLESAEGLNGTTTIHYSYAIYFREDNSIEWSKRWDLYFVNQEEGAKIHWMAIVNSLIICGVLTGVVLMILARTVRADIKGYRDGLLEKGKRKVIKDKVSGLLDQGDEVGVVDDDEDDDDEEDAGGVEDVTGWKLLHADVFRTPRNGHLLAPLVGSGMQLLFMAVGLVLLSALGILSPSFRGGFISFGVGLFVFAGLLSGYFSSRVYKTFGGRDWRRNTVVTATLFPGLLFAIVFVLNLFVWAQASSTALPFGTLIAMVFLWLCVQVPLVYAGAWYGFLKAGNWEYPTKTSSIPRQIPQQAWYIKGMNAALLAGLIPFAVIFIELLFVFQSVWQDKSGYYYVFGFLAVVSTILILTIAEVTVLAIYVQLCSENYHWWWSSFMVGGGSAVWVFAYCTWYYFAKLHITGFLSSLLFFSYSFMACCVYGLLTGTVGFVTAFAFVRRIYGAIKAD
ncbi:endomembrane protein 70 [Cladorrhinum sp. PSN259]|nr:endomembrane protein 70 [Cladorrhinum sp. PSN259]